MNLPSNSIDLTSVLTAVEDAGLFSATCTVQRYDGTRGPTGQEERQNDANWDVLIADIPCMDVRDMRPTITTATEKKSRDQIAAFEARHILLNGCFPAIDPRLDRAVVTSKNGVVTKLDITGYEQDSQAVMTRLGVQEVTY